MVLAFRSKRKAPEIAEGLGLSHYTYLSKLYKQAVLNPKHITNACNFFEVEKTIFEKPVDPGELRAAVEENRRQINLLKLENNKLQTEIALLSARLEECERKKRILEANKN